jgi:hypothetical protein
MSEHKFKKKVKLRAIELDPVEPCMIVNYDTLVLTNPAGGWPNARNKEVYYVTNVMYFMFIL